MNQNQQEVSGLPAVIIKTDPVVAQVVRESAGLNLEDWPNEKLQVISQTVCPPGTTIYQMAMFLSVAEKYGLDPFVGEIWLAKDGDKIIILTGRDSFLAIAERDPNYRGFDHAVVYEHDTFEVETDGDEIHIRHLISGFERGNRVGAYCLARREGRRPVLIIRRWDHYAHLHRKYNWKNNPDDMISTRVITTAHRFLYRISGIYTPEEFEGQLSEDGKLISVEDAGSASAQTQVRIDELRAQHEKRQRERNGEPDPDHDPDSEPISPDQVPEDIGSEKIAFGKWVDRTWRDVLENEPNGIGYVRHWVLGERTNHESLTEAVRAAVAQLIDEIEEERAKDAPDSLEGKEEVLNIDDLAARGELVATDAAKAGKLSTEEADALESLYKEGDAAGLKKLIDDLAVMLMEGDPELAL